LSGIAARVLGRSTTPSMTINATWMPFGQSLRAVSGGSLAAHIGPQSGDSFEKHPAVINRANADFLLVLRREAREDPLVDLVVAEAHLVLLKAKAPLRSNRS
jgi:hypothetical protein